MLYTPYCRLVFICLDLRNMVSFGNIYFPIGQKQKLEAKMFLDFGEYYEKLFLGKDVRMNHAQQE